MTDLAQSQAQPRVWTEEAFKRFWHHMGGIFGRPWYEQNGPEISPVWRSSVGELPLEKIAAVLQHFRVSGDSFPPNLSLFMKTARDIKIGQQIEKALPSPGPTPKVVQEAVGKMRARTRKTRSVFLPGENLIDYQKAMLESGMKESEFEAQRMVQNGWTAEDEAKYLSHAQVCGVRL